MRFSILLFSIVLAFSACKSSKVKEGETTNISDVEITSAADSVVVGNDYSNSLKIDSTSSYDIEASDLTGCWLDSREENSSESNIKIYRPCDFEGIPPSRFRYKVILEEDLTCSWLNLSPTDGHFMTNGTWLLKGNSISIFNDKGVEVNQFVINYIDNEVLKILAE